MTRSRTGQAFAVFVILCAGACTSPPADDRVSVPDVTGSTIDVVRARIEAAGLTFNHRFQANGSLDQSTGTASDIVAVTTDPAAGTRVARGSHVDVNEVTKAELIFFAKPMPDLAGHPWHGLGATEVDRYVLARWRKPEKGERVGVVVDQSPPQGTRLRLGQRMTVTITDRKLRAAAGGEVAGETPDVDLPALCGRTRWC